VRSSAARAELPEIGKADIPSAYQQYGAA